MEKRIKIFWLTGLVGVSLLFVSACNEEPPPTPKLTNPPQVISKPIAKSKPPVTQTNVPGDTGEKQAPLPDLKSVQDSIHDGPISDHGDGDSDLQKAGIFKAMAKYDSKGRVDPFVPLIAEKNTSGGGDSSEGAKPERTLTPLEKLALSQVKLVAIVEMQNRTIAMVEEATGKGYEVAVGTYIGPNGGRVTAITQDGIKIEEKVKNFQGQERKQYEEITFHKSEDGE